MRSSPTFFLWLNGYDAGTIFTLELILSKVYCSNPIPLLLDFFLLILGLRTLASYSALLLFILLITMLIPLTSAGPTKMPSNT